MMKFVDEEWTPEMVSHIHVSMAKKGLTHVGDIPSIWGKYLVFAKPVTRHENKDEDAKPVEEIVDEIFEKVAEPAPTGTNLLWPGYNSY